jgi:RNA-directed DNA polymerase
VSRRGTASDRQFMLPLGHAVHGDETGAGTRGVDAPVEGQDLLTRVLDPENLRRALHQGRRNQGAPGIDGMRVEQLGPHLKTHWPTIRASVVEGTYTPQPVRRVAIPKPGGGTRHLGVPGVLDRFIEQAVLQVLQPDRDPTFSEGSYGFRPKRRAQKAVAQAQAHIRQGATWVVDLDLEKFFDRVNHDVLLRRVRQRVPDRRVGR